MEDKNWYLDIAVEMRVVPIAVYNGKIIKNKRFLELQQSFLPIEQLYETLAKCRIELEGKTGMFTYIYIHNDKNKIEIDAFAEHLHYRYPLE
jgi:hypothetical protein